MARFQQKVARGKDSRLEEGIVVGGARARPDLPNPSTMASETAYLGTYLPPQLICSCRLVVRRD